MREPSKKGSWTEEQIVGLCGLLLLARALIFAYVEGSQFRQFQHGRKLVARNTHEVRS